MHIEAFDYELPPNLIPSAPDRPRGTAQMMVVERQTGEVQHRTFGDLPEFLHDGDVVILNDTKVMPTVLKGHTSDKAQVRVDLVSNKGGQRWDCYVRRTRELEPGTALVFADGALEGIVVGPNDFGTGTLIDLNLEGSDLLDVLTIHADYMLPLYLDRGIAGDDYQTVYAKVPGSNQPPVAGMHFTDAMMDRLAGMGVQIHYVTLRIGRLDDLSLLTSTDSVESHRMYSEAYEVPTKTADAINAARAAGHRVVCVGTTSVRTLETVANEDGTVRAGHAWTDCYITPGRPFRVVDVLLSNLQPPRTTNLILHCAFAGTENVISAYRDATARHYKFLEFGDCVLYV